jgi:hypothetical protein
MDPLPRALSLRLLRRQICSPCSRSITQRSFHNSSRLRDSRQKNYVARPGDQANPLAGYYAELLDQPLHVTASATRTSATPSPPDELPKTEEEERLAKARLVFGSRLAGPLERRKKIDSISKNIAGVLVPPRPGEPDNCCMSGCANCVWDLYRDDLEEWAAKSALARERMMQQRQRERPKPPKNIPIGTGTMAAQPGTPSHVATSMDDDGGGSDTNWDSGLSMPGAQGDLFSGVPVGIREFMKTEKMLRDKHRSERAAPS